MLDNGVPVLGGVDGYDGVFCHCVWLHLCVLVGV